MSWFIEVVKKYAVFAGRARRKEYWMFTLFALIIYAVVFAIAFAIHAVWIGLILELALLLPSWGVTVRRLHDTGRSGWWILLSAVPLVGGIIVLVWLCSDGKPGENQYGPNPKEIPAFA
ncbi:DUF805 domain-containing protein [Streptomyces sp. NPDC087903]|uniref:DUF805 domain-containing protein n=1 Tax=Streptomyces sp. NPDC087903 TaxID=3365819 RepID=UPI0038007B8E